MRVLSALGLNCRRSRRGTEVAPARLSVSHVAAGSRHAWSVRAASLVLLAHSRGVCRRDHHGVDRVIVLRLESGLAQDAVADLDGFDDTERINKSRRKHTVHHLLDTACFAAQTVDPREYHLFLT